VLPERASPRTIPKAENGSLPAPAGGRDVAVAAARRISYNGRTPNRVLPPPGEAAMLEIILLYALGKNIAEKAENQGRGGALFVIILIVLWSWAKSWAPSSA
jgi:hypothetical protein